jgi:hypothetical protein
MKGEQISMAKYGLFDGANAQPSQTFEGDTLQQNGEYVAIWTREPNSTVLDEQVAAIRLEKGQSVRKIE